MSIATACALVILASPSSAVATESRTRKERPRSGRGEDSGKRGEEEAHRGLIQVKWDPVTSVDDGDEYHEKVEWVTETWAGPEKELVDRKPKYHTRGFAFTSNRGASQTEYTRYTTTSTSKSSKGSSKTSKSKGGKGKSKSGKTSQRRSRSRSPPSRNDRAPSIDSIDAPSRGGCIDRSRYYEIYDDVAEIASLINNDKDLSHFYGSVIRLAAHDFMDYDRDAHDEMGSDGCMEWNSLSNSGLSSLWNEHSNLYKLHEHKYPDISRADFWIAAANAVVYRTSVHPKLDLRDTYYWGRLDREECPGSAERLPKTEGCRQVEDVFLHRMGLEWRDAVALLGAHTLGRGHNEFSGHHGTWVPNDREAQIFDRAYFAELAGRSWTRRNALSDPEKWDWSTGGDPYGPRPKMMLNTDICLFYNIDEWQDREDGCCTRTDLYDSRGDSHCDRDKDTQCGLYEDNDPRTEAAMAVLEFLGEGDNVEDGDVNGPFYAAFRVAWLKATMNGMHNLHPMLDHC